MRPNKIEKAAVAALEDIKARDIILLDTRPLTAIYDTLIVATAESARQTKALARHVRDKVREAGGQVLSIEGEETGEWVLVDCTEMVVHIMLPTTRALYNLEELWTAPTPIKRPKVDKPVAAVTTKAKAAGITKTAERKATRATRATKAAVAPVATEIAAATTSAAKKTATKTITKATPAVVKPATKKPATKRPTAKAPAAKKVAAKKPVAKAPAVTKAPTAKAPAAKTPAAKMSPIKRPAASKRRST